jgi:hypothetical protein
MLIVGCGMSGVEDGRRKSESTSRTEDRLVVGGGKNISRACGKRDEIVPPQSKNLRTLEPGVLTPAGDIHTALIR